MTPLSRREQNKADTRARIIAAATAMFLSRGVEHSTVSEVAQQAGVSRGTFFNYFPTKDSVLTAMWEDMSTRFAELMDEALHADTTTRQRIQGMFQSFAIAAEREPEYLLLVSGELNRDQPTGASSAARSNHIGRKIVPLVEAGQSQGDVRADHDANFLANMVAAGYIAAIMRWREDPRMELRHEFTQTANFIADSIAPRDLTDWDS